MSFVRQNLLQGTLTSTLADDGTTLASDELAGLVEVAGGDRARLVLDPQGVNGTPEIIDVVAHTAEATSATIERAVEDADRFPAREHAEGTAWHLADTADTLPGIAPVTEEQRGTLPRWRGRVVYNLDEHRLEVFDDLWRDLAGQPAEDLIVAVGASGATHTSTDGETWTERTNDAFDTININSVAFSPELGQWCAVGASGRLAVSNDMITWNRTSPEADPFGNNAITGLAWSPELGQWCATSSLRIGISSDGYEWDVAHLGSGQQIRVVTWAPELGLWLAVRLRHSTLTSPDGIDWTEHEHELTPGTLSFVSVAWSPELELFVVVGDKIATSPDGINWTEQDSSFGTSPVNWVVWSPELELFVAVGNSGKIATSPDGETWTQRTSSFGSTVVRGVAWSRELGVLVAVGSSGKIATSPDGIDWTQQTSGTTGTLYGVAAR